MAKIKRPHAEDAWLEELRAAWLAARDQAAQLERVYVAARAYVRRAAARERSDQDDLASQWRIWGACQVCGNPLRGRRRDTRYCSPACTQKAYRTRRGHVQAKSASAAAPQARPSRKAATTGGVALSRQDDPDRDPRGGYLDTDWLRVKPGDRA
jgi:hypothetical protein